MAEKKSNNYLVIDTRERYGMEFTDLKMVATHIEIPVSTIRYRIKRFPFFIDGDFIVCRSSGHVKSRRQGNVNNLINMKSDEDRSR